MKTLPIVFSTLAMLSRPLVSQPTVVADAPEVHDPFTLTAGYDVGAGHNSFYFAGKSVPPTIRVLPGGEIKVQYVNDLPVHSNEQCALGPCADHSNLHFHGLHVSPDSSPGRCVDDDVDSR